MCRTALPRQNPGLLVHVEAYAEERSVVEHPGIADPRSRIILLDVARSIHRLTGLDRGDGRPFDHVVRQVEIDPVDTLDRIAVVADLVDLVVLARRIVHDHHIGAGIVIVRDAAAVELERRGTQRTDLARGGLITPLELRRRFAEAERQHAVDLLQNPALGLGQPVGSDSPGRQITQLAAAAAQQFPEHRAHLRRVVRMGRLRHDLAGNHAVLPGHVVEEVPHTAVIHRRLEEELHVAVGHRPVRRRKDILQEKVALLEEVPEIAEVVREVEIGHTETFDHRGSQHIHRGEHPATPRLFLVGDALHRYAVFEIVVRTALQCAVQGQLLEVRLVGEDVLQRDGLRVPDKRTADLVQVVFRQLLGRHGECCRSEHRRKQDFLHGLRPVIRVIVQRYETWGIYTRRRDKKAHFSPTTCGNLRK